MLIYIDGNVVWGGRQDADLSFWVAMKPWEETDNQIRQRVRNPDDFQDGTLKTKPLTGEGEGVSIIVGKLKPEKVPEGGNADAMVVQSYRFDKSIFKTVDEAKAWFGEHVKKAEKAQWSSAFINDLPDSSFAIILPGGELDEDKKTVPRSLRKFPYKDGDGNVDVPHLKNAIARLPQSDLTDAQKKRVFNVLARAAGNAEVEISAEVIEQYKKGQKMTREEKLKKYCDEEGNLKIRRLKKLTPLIMTVCKRGANGKVFTIVKSADVKRGEKVEDLMKRYKSVRTYVRDVSFIAGKKDKITGHKVFYTVAYPGFDDKNPVLDDIDTDGEVIYKEDLRQFAHSYLASGLNTTMDISHDGEPRDIKVVESFINDDVVASKNWPPNAWVIGVDPYDDPDVAKKMENGEMLSVSISFGYGEWEEVVIPKDKVPEIVDPYKGRFDNHLLEKQENYNFIPEPAVPLSPKGVGTESEYSNLDDLYGGEHRFDNPTMTELDKNLEILQVPKEETGIIKRFFKKLLGKAYNEDVTDFNDQLTLESFEDSYWRYERSLRMVIFNALEAEGGIDKESITKSLTDFTAAVMKLVDSVSSVKEKSDRSGDEYHEQFILGLKEGRVFSKATLKKILDALTDLDVATGGITKIKDMISKYITEEEDKMSKEQMEALKKMLEDNSKKLAGDLADVKEGIKSLSDRVGTLEKDKTEVEPETEPQKDNKGQGEQQVQMITLIDPATGEKKQYKVDGYTPDKSFQPGMAVHDTNQDYPSGAANFDIASLVQSALNSAGLPTAIKEIKESLTGLDGRISRIEKMRKPSQHTNVTTEGHGQKSDEDDPEYIDDSPWDFQLSTSAKS